MADHGVFRDFGAKDASSIVRCFMRHSAESENEKTYEIEKIIAIFHLPVKL